VSLSTATVNRMTSSTGSTSAPVQRLVSIHYRASTQGANARSTLMEIESHGQNSNRVGWNFIEIKCCGDAVSFVDG